MPQPSEYSVLWTKPAKEDLYEIVSFIAQDSPQAAEKCMKKLEMGVGKLAWSPHRGRTVPELTAFCCYEYRELIIKPWRVIYKIDGLNVYVMVVIDARRNVGELLLAKLLRPRLDDQSLWRCNKSGGRSEFVPSI